MKAERKAGRGMKCGLAGGRLLSCILPSAFCLAVSGCQQQNAATTQPTTRPASMRERQDQAMRDPFGYSPNPESTDISGGGLSDFDRGGFNKDLKNVLDP
jgi:hypothetical protein